MVVVVVVVVVAIMSSPWILGAALRKLEYLGRGEKVVLHSRQKGGVIVDIDGKRRRIPGIWWCLFGAEI